MIQKRREALDIKAQKADNEPVYIKRGPLSAEHKKHISEGLKKYYQEHPEKYSQCLNAKNNSIEIILNKQN